MTRRICTFRPVAALIGTWMLAGTLSMAPAAEKERAAEILKATGVQGGVIVHLGCGDGKLTAALRANDGYLVQGLDSHPANVAAARQYIQSLKLYGPVSVDLHSGQRLPYIDNFANLVVAERLDGVALDEVMRVLVPNGVAYVNSDGKWTRSVKPRPKEMDEWTHYLHDPSNNAVAHDSAIAPLRRFQWLGSPLYSRHHDHMSAISAMVSSGGRVFYIFDEAPRPSILIPPQWYLTARDAFNGSVLWKRPIATWHTHLWPLKSGPQLMTRRLVASGDRLYVTLGIDEPLSVLDAATGKTIRTYEKTKATEEILYDKGVLFLSVAGEGQPLRSDPKKVYATVAEVRANVSDPLWTEAPRTLMAVDAQSGKTLWTKEATVVSMSLTADSQRVLFYDGQRLQCVDRGTGQMRWSSDQLPRREMRSSGGVTVVIHDDVVLYSGLASEEKKGCSTVYALSIKDGKTLWQAAHPPCGHSGSPDDILVVGGLVWWGAVAQGADSGIMTGRDLHTGEIKKEIPPDVQTHWFHHRCYRAKATDNYLLFSRTGIEFIDLDSSHWTTHHWVRGGCLYGVMPCNGLVYNPPHPCACYLEAKLYGFNALAPASTVPPAPIPDGARLVRGPAYQSPLSSSPAAPADWPTYRHDATRGAASKSPVAHEGLASLWQTELGGKLSSVVVADGRLLVASVDTHTVHALDANTGKSLWSFTAGGRVDTPPTTWQGRVLFGSADGCVYCLNAADGQLAWRYHAAPENRRLVAFEQIESLWPVQGAVLVQNDRVYCVAGRSMFLDGGLRLLRLDAKTGQKISETVLDDRDPETKDNLQIHVKGLNMPVALPDVLSSDGRYVYMRSLPFDMEGKRKFVDYVDVKSREGDDLHLFSPTGFLDDTMWHRTYWVYGHAFASGAGGYYQAGKVAPAGRLLVADEDTVYGYGRQWQFYRWTTPLEFQLFAAAKLPEVVASGAPVKPVSAPKSADKKKKGTMGMAPGTRIVPAWSDSISVQVNSMLLADQTLFVAGVEDLIDEEQAASSIGDPEIQKKLADQEAAFTGKRGGLLVAVSRTDGKRLAAYRLESMPTFDGMAAAAGRLYMSTSDGKVVCLASGGPKRLPAADEVVVSARPIDVPSPAAKAESRTKRPSAARTPTSSHPDFQELRGVSVEKSDLGYRLESDGKQTGVALKKLPAPLTRQAVLRVQMKPLAVEGHLQTGFLVFGDGEADEQLVKCGVRLRMKKAFISQGAAGKDKGGTSAEFAHAVGQVLDVEVAVDLASGKIKMTLPGKVVEAQLERPLKSISYVGYSVMNSATEFAPVQISGE